MEGRGTYVWTWTFHKDPMKFDPYPHPKSPPFTQLVAFVHQEWLKEWIKLLVFFCCKWSLYCSWGDM